jgi:hypothetical protein
LFHKRGMVDAINGGRHDQKGVTGALAEQWGPE